MSTAEKMVPTTPEEVLIDKGPPIALKEHLRIYGPANIALEFMKKRCEAGHDWVCAAYIDQIEHFIKSMMKEPSRGVRGSVMVMLYGLEPDVADWIDVEWERLEAEYGVETTESETGEIIYGLKGVRPEKQSAMLAKIGQDLVIRFEDEVLSRLGQDRYMKIQEIRRKVRRDTAGALVVPMARGKAEEERRVVERRAKEKKKEAVGERVAEIDRAIERLAKEKQRMKREMEKRF